MNASQRMVVVSQRVDDFPARGECRDSLDQRISLFLAEAGLAAVPVPNAFCAQALVGWLDRLAPAGIILSGGNDIGERIARDQTERGLLDYARQHNLPLLGICRGMQMMAVWSGTALKPVQGHVRTRHVLRGEVSGDVNSFHGFALEACPDDFAVLASSEDGEIEAIKHQALPWEGWMWHPERESPFSLSDIQRLQALFAQ